MPAEDIILLVGLPPRKYSSFLYPVKDDVELKTTCMCSILHDCGWVYIGQTGIPSSQSEGALLAYPTWQINKLAVAEHIFNHSHHIHFLETKIFSTKSGYLDLPPRWGNWVGAQFQQYEEGGWPEFKWVVGTSHLLT